MIIWREEGFLFLVKEETGNSSLVLDEVLRLQMGGVSGAHYHIVRH